MMSCFEEGREVRESVTVGDKGVEYDKKKCDITDLS